MMNSAIYWVTSQTKEYFTQELYHLVRSGAELLDCLLAELGAVRCSGGGGGGGGDGVGGGGGMHCVSL